MHVLARRRVPLGFCVAVAALIFAQPTWETWSTGLTVALAGEVIRIWAAGHLEKGREVTQSGPYRWTRHPLYVGSSVVALGVIIAARSPLVTIVTLLYMVATLTAAIRTEEAFLRRAFGTAYESLPCVAGRRADDETVQPGACAPQPRAPRGGWPVRGVRPAGVEGSAIIASLCGRVQARQSQPGLPSTSVPAERSAPLGLTRRSAEREGGRLAQW